ncbi:MAG: class I SAM-dependent methyltransferase [Bacteroidia bacterium]|nr:class I SAM-dependent methyltransferase [Bacteroidia bacterium]
MTHTCPFCKSQNTKQYLKLKDYFLTQEEFEIHECADCHLLFTTPRPTPLEIGKYYKSEDYLSHNEHKKGFVPWVYNRVKKKNIKRKFEIAFANNFVKKDKTRLLDYGCGVGDFLFYAKQHGCYIYGCDLSEDARKFASKKLKTEIYDPEKLSALPDWRFDVITLWHVFEHVDDLEKLVYEFHRLIADKGRLVIAVPNYKSHDAEIYKDKWAAYDVPRHLNHFHKDSLEIIMKDKFKLKKIHPLKWDAFYISMMSENYVGRGNSFVKGVISGLKSNRRAKKTGEYSSLVYVFDKI